MRNFQRKRGWRDIMQSKIVLMLLGILILVFSWNIFGFWNKMQETEKNKKMVEDKVAALKQQKEDISSKISDLETEQGKEKVFREDYGLAQEGEGVIVIVDDKNSNQSPQASPSGISSFFSFLRNLFK